MQAKAPSVARAPDPAPQASPAIRYDDPRDAQTETYRAKLLRQTAIMQPMPAEHAHPLHAPAQHAT